MKKVTLVIVGLIAGFLLSPTSSNAEGSERLLVFGDSMTAQNTDDAGDPMQGWWSIMAQERGWDVKTSAQGGGGLIKKGSGCYGTSVRERAVQAIDQHQPTRIGVAVGYNDKHVCIDGRAVSIAPDFRARAAIAAFEQIGAAAESIGMDRADVFVTVPWGTKDVTQRNAVVTAYSDAARAAGLTFINVRRFNQDETRDGTHPNRKGALLIANTLGAVQ